MDFNKFQIFLDIDGVLVSYLDMKDYLQDNHHGFTQESIIALNTIITFYDADLCMISAWNNQFRTEQEYKDFLVSRGIIVNNITFGDNQNRDGFIVSLINQGLKDYLIIDDEAHSFYSSMPKIEYKRILQPNRFRALDKFDAKIKIEWIERK